MELLVIFQLLQFGETMWLYCYVGVFYLYDLFIVTTAMLDDWLDHLIKF
jgi:hypothetical protein